MVKQYNFLIQIIFLSFPSTLTLDLQKCYLCSSCQFGRSYNFAAKLYLTFLAKFIGYLREMNTLFYFYKTKVISYHPGCRKVY